MSRKLYYTSAGSRRVRPPDGGRAHLSGRAHAYGAPFRDRATRTPVAAMSAAEVSSVTEIPPVWAKAASANPPTISPADSAWDRKECMVVRTSLVVRRFTQITL